MNVKEVHEYLLQLAGERHAPITYGQLAHHFGETIGGNHDVKTLSRILYEVSTTEHVRGNPLLSVMVINQELRRPSDAFYTMAEEHGRFKGQSEADKVEFFKQEVTAVHNHWGS